MIALFSPDHAAMPQRQREAIESLCAMVATNRASYAVQDFVKRSKAARKGGRGRLK